MKNVSKVTQAGFLHNPRCRGPVGGGNDETSMQAVMEMKLYVGNNNLTSVDGGVAGT